MEAMKTVLSNVNLREHRLFIGIIAVISIFVLATAASAMSTITECCADKSKKQARYNFYAVMLTASVLILVACLLVILGSFLQA